MRRVTLTLIPASTYIRNLKFPWPTMSIEDSAIAAGKFTVDVMKITADEGVSTV